MAKLKTVKPRMPMVGTRLSTAPTASENRMTGRKLQGRRIRLWSANPRCAGCGRLTLFPHGFEVDHVVALEEGGQDVDGNCQILCVYPDELGRKAGCHAEKTRRDRGYRPRG